MEVEAFGAQRYAGATVGTLDLWAVFTSNAALLAYQMPTYRAPKALAF